MTGTRSDELLNSLVKAADTFELSDVRPLLWGAKEIAGRPERLDIAVVGRFKAGKSSVLNSILGEEILPTGVLPVTALVISLAYSDRSFAKILFADGSQKESPLEELSSFVSEDLNPKNVKGVQAVEVFTPLLKTYENLRFIDTPGLGSVFQHNTDVAQTWLPRIAAALVCVAPDPPMSKEERELIARVSSLTSEVHVLLTKSDLVSEADREKIVRFIREYSGEVFSGRIIPYSTKPQFSEMRENGLLKYLEEASASVSGKVDQVISAKLRLARDLILSRLKLAAASAKATEAARTEFSKQVGKSAEAVPRLNEEFRMIQEQFRKDSRARIAEILSKDVGALAGRIVPRIEAEFRNDNERLVHRSSRFEIVLSEMLRNELARLSMSSRKEIARIFLSAGRQIRERGEYWQNQFVRVTKEVFNVPLEPAPLEREPRLTQRPDIRVSVSLDAPVAILGSLFPMLVRKNRLLRKFKRQTEEEIKKNISRLTTQWHDLLCEELQEYAAQIVKHLEITRRTLEGLVNEKSGAGIDRIQSMIQILETSDSFVVARS